MLILQELHLLHEPEIPKGVLYYGWFFSEEVNITLKQLSNFYLSECLKVPSFERFLKTQCNILDERGKETGDICSSSVARGSLS